MTVYLRGTTWWIYFREEGITRRARVGVVSMKSPEQTDEYLDEVVMPRLDSYQDLLGDDIDSSLSV